MTAYFLLPVNIIALTAEPIISTLKGMHRRQHRKLFHFFTLVFPVVCVVLGILFVLGLRAVTKPNISAQRAIQTVSHRPEVTAYVSAVPNAKIQIDHMDSQTDEYVIQVFEVKEGHTATFNWYRVSKTTGAVRKEFTP